MQYSQEYENLVLGNLMAASYPKDTHVITDTHIVNG